MSYSCVFRILRYHLLGQIVALFLAVALVLETDFERLLRGEAIVATILVPTVLGAVAGVGLARLEARMGARWPKWLKIYSPSRC